MHLTIILINIDFEGKTQKHIFTLPLWITECRLQLHFYLVERLLHIFTQPQYTDIYTQSKALLPYLYLKIKSAVIGQIRLLRFELLYILYLILFICLFLFSGWGIFPRSGWNGARKRSAAVREEERRGRMLLMVKSLHS